MRADLEDIISSDIWNIFQEVGGQDGVYKNSPIERILRTKETNVDIIRIYVLDANVGGIVLIGDKSFTESREWSIIQLGEDDGWFSVWKMDNYPMVEKSDLFNLLRRAMSLMNNNSTD